MTCDITKDNSASASAVGIKYSLREQIELICCGDLPQLRVAQRYEAQSLFPSARLTTFAAINSAILLPILAAIRFPAR